MSRGRDALVGVLARVLGRPLERRDPVTRADAIVVLGAPLRRDGGLTGVVEERVQAGVSLWRRGIAPLLCMTGGKGPGVVAEVAEADAMAARARELGVPEAALVIEAASRNTSTNARNIKKLLDGSGAARVVVVTQPFHSRRSVLWFRRVGLDAVAWRIENGLQDQEPRRALRWIVKEYGSLARDLLVTRHPGE
jgi:uncharacterized SAM-binding protein YcdF (DUF218 family)